MRSIVRLFGRVFRFFADVNRALREINEKGMGPK